MDIPKTIPSKCCANCENCIRVNLSPRKQQATCKFNIFPEYNSGYDAMDYSLTQKVCKDYFKYNKQSTSFYKNQYDITL
jgi:hypothetical protein